jgi:PAT family acetyl-CoA transporter-like MFS transporter 1
MPTPLGESLFQHHNRHISDAPPVLPLTISTSRPSGDQARNHNHSIELEYLSPRETAELGNYIHPISSGPSRDTVVRARASLEQTESQRLISSPSSDAESDSEPDTPQMGRKSNAPNEDSQHEANATSSGRPNGTTNGHANGKMNKNLEMRRKNAVLDSPTKTANFISRESFSLDNEPPPTPIHHSDVGFFDLPMQDRKNFLLLVLLYFLQGIPMGLAGGSVPFLLKKHLSYGQIGVFTLASYPYSLKLLWSPIVDAVWSPTLGRRKSWILPIQFFSGFGMIYMGGRAAKMMIDAEAEDGSGVWTFTWWWFFLVFLCATQDIAVDGWALTLLSTPNLSYASTAQTVGLTAGQFLSYTVFLAFNSPDFANRWFRQTPSSEGVMTLGGYLTFWGYAYLIVTLGLAVLKREERTKERDGIMEVYKTMWGILKLRNIQSIIIIHLIAKIGFQANDAVTNLKLLDKGFSQEDMALTVLIDFPFEISLGYIAGRWSTAHPPIHVWCWGFIGRLVAAGLAQATVMIFPTGGVTNWYLLTVICSHIISTFTSTVMFVAISAFHAKIADPVIGGTYMTLLAT